MNLNLAKKSFLFCVILIIGLISIDSFLFPRIEESCTCRMGEEVGQILCAGLCPDQDCGVMRENGGYCEGSSCITKHTIMCLTTDKETKGVWSEPCWSCFNW